MTNRKWESPSENCEYIIKKLFESKSDDEITRSEIISKIEETKETDINANVLSGVLNKLKKNGYLITVNRGKYMLNKVEFNKDKESIQYKIKLILDTVVDTFESEIDKNIKVQDIKTIDDINAINKLNNILEDLKNKNLN